MEKSSQILDFLLLIPFFNNREGLVQSLRSIDYDPGKCAVLIIDDGSKEPLNADALLRETDTALNIEIIRLSINRGIAIALNEGLNFLAKRGGYKYIARLDCGDLCSKDRFVAQVKYLDAHPGIDLLGSWCTFEDPRTRLSYLYKTPVQPDGITRGMYFRNIFIHPTVMYRADVMEKQNYPIEFPHAEDYGLFYRLMLKVNYAILPQNLVICKMERSGLSLSNRKEQLKSRMEVVKKYGRSKILVGLVVLKVQLLLIIPYKLIWRLKLWLYRPVVF